MAKIVCSFATLAGGVWIEEPKGCDRREQKPTDRCFRFDSEGRAEYALLGDLRAGAERARWYGHCYTVKDFTLC